MVGTPEAVVILQDIVKRTPDGAVSRLGHISVACIACVRWATRPLVSKCFLGTSNDDRALVFASCMKVQDMSQ